MINRSKFILLLILLLALVLAPVKPVVLAQDEIQGRTTRFLYVHTRPGAASDPVAQLPAGWIVFVEGRDLSGRWLLVRTPDSAAQGWVIAQYMTLPDGVTLDALPVMEISTSQSPGDAFVATTGVTTPQFLNVRTGPSTANDWIGQLDLGTTVALEGRDEAGDWLLVQTGDGRIRGWVYGPYVRVNGNVASLPLSTAIIDQEQSASALPGPVAEMERRLESTPVLYNILTDTVYETFRRGQAQGNRVHVFSLLGDSVSAWQPFMRGFGHGQYDLGPYTNLQTTIDWFDESPHPNAANSFVHISYTLYDGFTSGAMFDSIWMNPSICQGAPITCEYETVRPSVAIIHLVVMDMLTSTDPETYRAQMYRIAETSLDYGVIPVFTTATVRPDYLYEEMVVLNNIVVDTAEVYDVPLINLWRAAQSFPDAGTLGWDPTHLSEGEGIENYAFSGAEKVYGTALRNLLTLQMLEELRVNVLAAGA